MSSDKWHDTYVIYAPYKSKKQEPPHKRILYYLIKIIKEEEFKKIITYFPKAEVSSFVILDIEKIKRGLYEEITRHFSSYFASYNFLMLTSYRSFLYYVNAASKKYKTLAIAYPPTLQKYVFTAKKRSLANKKIIDDDKKNLFNDLTLLELKVFDEIIDLHSTRAYKKVVVWECYEKIIKNKRYIYPYMNKTLRRYTTVLRL